MAGTIVEAPEGQIDHLLGRLAGLSGEGFDLLPPHHSKIRQWLGDRPLTATIRNTEGSAEVEIIEAGRPNVGIGFCLDSNGIGTWEWGAHETYDVFDPGAKHQGWTSLGFANSVIFSLERAATK